MIKEKKGGVFFFFSLPGNRLRHRPKVRACRKQERGRAKRREQVVKPQHAHAARVRPTLFPQGPFLCGGWKETDAARGGPKRTHHHTSHGSSTSLAGRGMAARAHSESDELHPKSLSLHTTVFGARVSLAGGGGGGPARTPSSSSDSLPSSSEQAEPVAPREKGDQAAAAKGEGVAVAGTPQSTPHVTVNRARVPAPGTDRARARHVEAGGARDFLHGGGDGGDGGRCCGAVGVEGGGVEEVLAAASSGAVAQEEADVLCGCECGREGRFGWREGSGTRLRGSLGSPPPPPAAAHRPVSATGTPHSMQALARGTHHSMAWRWRGGRDSGKSRRDGNREAAV